MKKCLLKGFFGHRNLGDDLLYEESISKIPSEYHIYTNGNCPYPEDLKRENVTLVHSFREILSHKYDLTIINGGGYSPSVRYRWASLLRDILIRLRSKKMVLNGVGLAPKIGTWNRLRYKMFLKMLDYCSVRDNVSKSFIDSLIGKDKCINCHDLYFAKELLSNYDKREGVLVCIANPFGKAEMETEHFQKRYHLLVSNIQAAILRLKETYGSVSFLPFYKGSDEIIIKDIMCHPRLADSYVLVNGIDFTVNNIDALFAKYKVGLCMRFHSFVLSVRNTLPFVGICYDYKSESLLEEMNLPDVGVRYGIRKSDFFGIEQDFGENNIMSKVEYVVKNYAAILNKLEYFRLRFNKEVNDNYKRIYSLIGKT